MNEAETRHEYIDPALKAAGWGVIEGSRLRLEYKITDGRLLGQGKRAKAEIADYVLVYKNTPLAIVEAKAWDKPPTLGAAQAKSYAKMMGLRYTYATNGQGIYRVDMETGLEGEVKRYPSPQELWDATFAAPNLWRDRFATVPFETKGGSYNPRYYSDLFDVLAHIAYSLPPLTREERATKAKAVIKNNSRFTDKQQIFLDFVLGHYVEIGTDKLDREKLTPLLKLKYHDSLHDAVDDLGNIALIGQMFSNFQQYSQ